MWGSKYLRRRMDRTNGDLGVTDHVSDAEKSSLDFSKT